MIPPKWWIIKRCPMWAPLGMSMPVTKRTMLYKAK